MRPVCNGSGFVLSEVLHPIVARRYRYLFVLELQEVVEEIESERGRRLSRTFEPSTRVNYQKASKVRNNAIKERKEKRNQPAV